MQASTNIRRSPSGRRAGRSLLLVIVAALVMAVAALLFASAGSDRASAAPQQGQVRYTVKWNPDWTGWSAHPEGGVRVAAGSWRVPAVKCGAAPIGSKAWAKSRAAVWVGMWGKFPLSSAKTWLPQIGTNSQCRNGVFAGSYAVAELHHKGQPGPKSLFDVQPGDRIRAVVVYMGREPGGELKFQALLSDEDARLRGQEWQFNDYAYSNPGVPREEAAWQGGCIVERDPETDLSWDLIPNGGLAKFPTPIQFRQGTYQQAGKYGCGVEDLKGPPGGESFKAIQEYNTLYLWAMTSDGTKNGIILAHTKVPKGVGWGGGEFPVSWGWWR